MSLLLNAAHSIFIVSCLSYNTGLRTGYSLKEIMKSPQHCWFVALP
jgi:hypothetical protein